MSVFISVRSLYLICKLFLNLNKKKIRQKVKSILLFYVPNIKQMEYKVITISSKWIEILHFETSFYVSWLNYRPHRVNMYNWRLTILNCLWVHAAAITSLKYSIISLARPESGNDYCNTSWVCFLEIKGNLSRFNLMAFFFMWPTATVLQ